ncbi:hypothetical protein Q6D67_15510 [Haliea sp. E1-2-M8]|uniref:hypothetical protein n=1 Tax=Haliea sp. E1-2-M8 TaxID=3064706 RepID=UPI0027290E27|nr:hypothetical protein [Haliea sp. E1-2-M8]MDO8863113.1 hypothetical protein [Haliea sp. E1-2-M8]
MLKSIVVATAMVFTMSASALPQGKPFQELAAQISALDSEIAELQQRIDDGDAALTDAVATLAEQVAANSGLIASTDDILDQLAIETRDLAVAVGTTDEALASLAFDMAAKIAALAAEDQALAARLAVLEAIDHAKVTGQCPDGSVVVELTETSIICESVEQSSDPFVYSKNVSAEATSATVLTVLPKCDNASDRSYNGGFLASPSTATVSENFLQFNTHPAALATRQIKANNATRLVGYIVCERAAQ